MGDGLLDLGFVCETADAEDACPESGDEEGCDYEKVDGEGIPVGAEVGFFLAEEDVYGIWG